MKCALCSKKSCYEALPCDASPPSEEYEGEDLAMLRAAAEVEAEGYMRLCRIEEVVEFAKKMGYHRLGIAFCIGLEREAAMLHRFLVARGFEVCSVMCKVCGVSKDELGLKKIGRSGVEVMCNPITQAKVLNEEGCELNLVLGLCVGHDILFTKHSAAPVSTIAVKDRMLAHNPLGALYSSYWRKRLGV
ncbi:DUF1847 domain-containing protein [Methermicoccus shengliensis]|uniref:DUF1847 domain-containing protein n=1 Tax=Methermicoccus shengliensis TaxID=660064 RepID=A0A832RXW8_9EURY|nr:DUF1847 domain-containing protein [Methermicoccus shengliensis]KUK05066.1 MAG: Uncharacterized protein XD46_0059 [Euryarchaeota archaeon 55_53]KUK30359.1 MAG: Uncharacterized protein XD62_0534 [Methanosarcinales archeaon 56_1174]MDI3487550.1 hypothetical protein [Methanosarcinales archaeon]MDN5294699.1 hypothetical protein [Methanosarcinales archaeon]HIH69411.1 DUF1847 domain-containing protein [Methermicoccus shengliensis]